MNSPNKTILIVEHLEAPIPYGDLVLLTQHCVSPIICIPPDTLCAYHSQDLTSILNWEREVQFSQITGKHISGLNKPDSQDDTKSPTTVTKSICSDGTST